MSFREGDKVEARYRGKARAYPGRIARVNRDGTYDVDYNDGDKERGVAADLIKLLESDSYAARRISAMETARTLPPGLLAAQANMIMLLLQSRTAHVREAAIDALNHVELSDIATRSKTLKV